MGYYFKPSGQQIIKFVVQKVNWDVAYQRCCSFGMRLVSIETVMKLEFLQMWKNNKCKKLICVSFFYCSIIYFLAAAIDKSAWVGATQKDCHYRFTWCGSGEELLRNDSRWCIN